MTMERAYMIIALLFLAVIALVALNIIAEMDKRGLREKNKEYIESNITYCKRIEELASENAVLHASCERLADENLRLTQEIAEWRGRNRDEL